MLATRHAIINHMWAHKNYEGIKNMRDSTLTISSVDKISGSKIQNGKVGSVNDYNQQNKPWNPL